MNREHNSDHTHTVTSRAAGGPDPVDLAIDALAAPRWSGSPDWRSFQEHVMSDRASFWRRTSLLSLLACGVLAAGAAAVAWEWFPISGTMTLNSGETVEVSGQMADAGDGSFTANLETGGADISGGGSMEITLPDGSKATLVVAPGGSAAPTPTGKEE